MLSLRSLLSNAKQQVVDFFNVYEELPVDCQDDDERQKRILHKSNGRGKRSRNEYEFPDNNEQWTLKIPKLENSIADRVVDEDYEKNNGHLIFGKIKCLDSQEDEHADEQENNYFVKKLRSSRGGITRSPIIKSVTPRRRRTSTPRKRNIEQPDYSPLSLNMESAEFADTENPFQFSITPTTHIPHFKHRYHSNSNNLAQNHNDLSDTTSQLSSELQTDDSKDEISVDSHSSKISNSQFSEKNKQIVLRSTPKFNDSYSSHRRLSSTPFRSSNSPRISSRVLTPNNTSSFSPRTRKRQLPNNNKSPKVSINWPLTPVSRNSVKNYDSFDYLIVNGIRIDAGINVYLNVTHREPYIAQIKQFNLSRDKKKSWCVSTLWYRSKNVDIQDSDDQELLVSSHKKLTSISVIDTKNFPKIRIFKNFQDVQVVQKPHEYYCYRAYDHKRSKVISL